MIQVSISTYSYLNFSVTLINSSTKILTFICDGYEFIENCKFPVISWWKDNRKYFLRSALGSTKKTKYKRMDVRDSLLFWQNYATKRGQLFICYSSRSFARIKEKKRMCHVKEQHDSHNKWYAIVCSETPRVFMFWRKDSI